MPKFSKLTCAVRRVDLDVRSPDSFRRQLSAEFLFDGQPSGVRVEGLLVRVFDGFAVKAVVRDDLKVPSTEKADLLPCIHREANLGPDPADQVSFTDFEVSERGSDALALKAKHLRTATWT